MNLRKTLCFVFLICGCFVANLLTVGCSSKVSDQALMTDIQAKLYADPTARSANVQVAVANGVATLTGDAPSSDVALKVVDIVNGVSGVKSVNNQLAVAPAAAAVQPPVAPVAPPPQEMQPPPAERKHHDGDHDGDHHDGDHHPDAPPAPPVPVNITVPAGTDIEVQMIDGISSQKNTSGQTFRASLVSPIVAGGVTAIPAGADATVLLAQSKGAGRIAGSSDLEIRLVSIQSGGQTYQVSTNVHQVVGKGRGRQTAVRSGVGAAAGAIIGAIAGGGKGAAIGTLAGGGAGAGFQLATHGQQVNIPSETDVSFTTAAPLTVTVSH
jgi:hypothetical protein